MRYKLVIMCLFVAFCNMSAQETLEKKAEKLYADKNYEQAAQIYEELMKKGESADLYYNYANTQFKTNNLGRAILFYEKALVLSPRDNDIKKSLDYANSNIVDKIDSYQPFFLAEWFYDISKIFNTNGWAVLTIVSFVLAMVLWLIYRFATILKVRKIAFYCGVVALLFALISLTYALVQKKYLQNNPYSIILENSVSAKASPSISGRELFVLHEGTKVKVASSNNNWLKIELADKRVAWIPETAAEQI